MEKNLQVILNVTHQCNLQCDYCYYNGKMTERAGHMDKKLLSLIMEKLSRSPYESINLCIHGGEPLLHDISYLNRIFEAGGKYLKDKKIDYSLQTNGTLISPEFGDFISKKREEGIKIDIGISIDGPPQVHNVHRKTKCGQGSFDLISEKLQHLEKFNIQYCVLAVISDATYEHLDGIYDFFRSLRGITVLDFIIPEYNKTYMPLQIGRLADIYTHLFEKWFYDGSAKFNVRDFSALLSRMTGQSGEGVCWSAPNCILNMPMISIDIEGNISPCDNFTHAVLGNITDGEIDAFMHKNKIRRSFAKLEDRRVGRCLFCEWYKICAGGCPKNVSSCGKESVYCNEFQRIYTFVSQIIGQDNLICSTKINPYASKILNTKNKAIM